LAAVTWQKHIALKFWTPVRELWYKKYLEGDSNVNNLLPTFFKEECLVMPFN